MSCTQSPGRRVLFWHLAVAEGLAPEDDDGSRAAALLGLLKEILDFELVLPVLFNAQQFDMRIAGVGVLRLSGPQVDTQPLPRFSLVPIVVDGAGHISWALVVVHQHLQPLPL